MSSSIKLFKALSLFYEEYIQPFDANACLVIIAILTVLYFAWKSTEVREIQRTVWIFDSHRFRRHNSLLVSVFSTSVQPNQSEATATDNQGQQEESATNAPAEPPPTVEQAIDEVYNLTGQQRAMEQRTIDSLHENIESVISETFQDPGPQQIIREMDRDDMELRYRPSTSAQARSLEADNTASTENCSNENSENEQISKTRSNVGGESAESPVNNPDESEFTVKLKYLNDDVKIVKAKPYEILRDFKSRNFTVELAAQKIVRLVFNGQVLAPDNKTLQSCGLFDNCVVHCLVHNRKNQPGEESNGESSSTSQGLGVNNTNSNGNGFLDLLSHRRFNTVFNCLSCLTVMFCWFCRFEYSYLFNIYSTLGLILITVMLIFMLPIVYLMDWD